MTPVITHILRCALLAVLFCTAPASLADSRDQARRIHDRLTGVPPTDAMLDAMAAALEAGRTEEAGLYAIDGAPGEAASGYFYTTVLKNWITPWTNEDQDPFAPLNDYSATVIGMVRDEADFRDILSADVIYLGDADGLPAYSPSDNRHYEALEAAGLNLGDPEVLVRRNQSAVTGLPVAAVAGVTSTRAAARAFFVDGTNRAMFRFTVLNHLCMDLEQLKDGTRPADRIRQDVSRSPGGDSRLFLNNCVECHAGMDPLAQAYAYYDFPYPDDAAAPGLELEQRKDLGRIAYTPGAVQPKYLINDTTFATGYVTASDHWTNYWRLGVNSGRVGWRGGSGSSGATDLAVNNAYTEGDGAASLGRELATSDAFAQCQVNKVFRQVCARDPGGSDAAAVNGFVGGFRGHHNIKRVFAQVAAHCAGHL